MADFQNLNIPLGKLDTKSDPRTVPAGTLTLAENVTTQQDGAYRSRYGYSALPSLGGSCHRMAARGGELVAVVGTYGGDLQAYDVGGLQFTSVGKVSSMQASQHVAALDQVSSSHSQTLAVLNGVVYVAWKTQAGVLWMRAYDATTGAQVRPQTQIDTGVLFVRALTLNGVVGFFYWNATGIMYHTYDAPGSCASGLLVAAAALTATLAAQCFDVSTYLDGAATRVLIAYPVVTTSYPAVARCTVDNIGAITVDASGALSASKVVAGSIAVQAFVGPTHTRAAVLCHTATEVVVIPFTASSLAPTATVQLDNLSTTSESCSIVYTDEGQAIGVWDDWSLTIPSTRWRAFAADTGNALAAKVTLYSAVLSSKAWLGIDGNHYVNVGFVDQADAFSCTTFTVKIAPSTSTVPTWELGAMHLYRASWYANVSYSSGWPGISDVGDLGAGQYVAAAPMVYKFVSATAPKVGTTVCGVDLADKTTNLPAMANGTMLLSGGVTQRYDGARVMEHGVVVKPFIVSTTPATSGGNMADGTYWYTAVFETTDANGNTDQSMTANPVKAVVSGGSGSGKVTVVVSQLNLTRVGSNAAAQQGSVTLFRTEKNGSTYYECASAAIAPSSDTVTFVDIKADASITSSRQVYTSGGVLDKEPPPASLHAVMHQGRIWCISASDPHAVFYSGDVKAGISPWFATTQQFRVDIGDGCTALASLDDKLVVFTADRIFKVYGRGANELGQANDIGLPALISSDCGCIDPRSLVSTPDGVMFLSSKGIYVLSRGEQVSYLGQAVDRWVSGYSECTSAVMVPDRREVRFTFESPIYPITSPAGVTLVYNYQSDAWTHWTLCGGAAAGSSAVVGGVWYWGNRTNTVYGEDSSTWLDADQFVQHTIETAWIAPSGQQGLSRVRQAGFLGDIKNACGLEIQVAKDYVPAYVMTKNWPASLLAALPRGQVFCHLQQQQGEAFRVRVSDYQDGDPGKGENFAASSLLLQAAAKRGNFSKFVLASAKG